MKPLFAIDSHIGSGFLLYKLSPADARDLPFSSFIRHGQAINALLQNFLELNLDKDLISRYTYVYASFVGEVLVTEDGVATPFRCSTANDAFTSTACSSGGEELTPGNPGTRLILFLLFPCQSAPCLAHLG